MTGFSDGLNSIEGMSAVPAIGGDGKPDFETRFWVTQGGEPDANGSFLESSSVVDGGYGGEQDQSIGRTPLDDLRAEVEGLYE